MKVYAIAEHIPKSYAELDIALYHIYESNFDLGDDAKIVISIAPQDAGVGLRED